MSVIATKSTIAYAADGVTKAFSFPYYYFDKTHLMVTAVTAAGVQSLKAIGDYDVTGVVDSDFSAYSNGGVVTFVTAPADGIILIQRRTPKLSLTNFLQYDNFRATDFNHAFDYLTLISQEGANGDVFKGFIAQAPTWGTWSKGDWFIITPPTPGELWALIATADGTGLLAAWRGFAGISYA